MTKRLKVLWSTGTEQRPGSQVDQQRHTSRLFMQAPVKTTGRLVTAYFADLWVFLPYIVLYLLWWGFEFPSESLVPIFQALHAVHCVGLSAVLWMFVRKQPPAHALAGGLFWIILILFLYLPGAYLEYPSDPWEHLRRLLRWQVGGPISQYLYDVKDKFSYFWGWTFFSALSLEQRRGALDIYASFWQLVVAIQVYRLLRIVHPSTISALAVLIFVAFFGTNIFGMRYYALSSSLLAYAAYVQVLIVILRRSSLRYLALSLLYLAALAFTNHKQELLFIAFMAPVALYASRATVSQADLTSLGTRRFVAITGVGLIVGGIVRNAFLPSALANELSFFGGFPIWNSFYMTTLGVLGWAGVVAALIAVGSGRGTVLSYLVLTPIGILVWPPTAILVLKSFPSAYLSYRLLYAMPAALGVIEGLSLVVSIFSTTGLKRAVWVVATCVVAWVSVQPNAPWRGRLWFALHESPKSREYQDLLPMVRWFKESWDLSHLRDCWIVTDDVSRTVLSFHLGMQEWAAGGEPSRRGQRQDARQLRTTEELVSIMRERPKFCGVLLHTATQSREVAPSQVATYSGHWVSEYADLKWQVSEGFRAAAEALPSRGWSRYDIPGGYELFVPPGAVGLGR